MAAMRLILVIVLLTAVVAIVAGVVLAASRRAVADAPQSPALSGPDPVLARVKDLAWDSREVDTELADALIGYLNDHERDADQRAVRNQVGEIAWAHRDSCPNLSAIVIAELRLPG